MNRFFLFSARMSELAENPLKTHTYGKKVHKRKRGEDIEIIPGPTNRVKRKLDLADKVAYCCIVTAVIVGIVILSYMFCGGLNLE